MITKHCNRCDCDKPLDAFASHPNTKDKKQRNCRQCQKEMRAEWQKNNGDEIRRKAKDARDLKKKLQDAAQHIADNTKGPGVEIVPAPVKLSKKRRTQISQAFASVTGDGTGQALPPMSHLERTAGERDEPMTLAEPRNKRFTPVFTPMHAIAPNPGAASPPLGEGGGETTKEVNEEISSTTSTSLEKSPAEKTDKAAFGGELKDIERLPALSVSSTHAANDNTTGLADLRHAAIVRSKTNPRRIFDEAWIRELGESIREQGILQPILVRPLPGSRLQETLEDLLPGQPRPTHEIVAGEQRWRAAGLVGLRTMPALVRNLTDAQVLTMQLVENLRRRDLHPMEEAEGYERLMQTTGQAVEEIAASVGKGSTYVYDTLSLLQLIPEARTAFYAGDLVKSVAQQIARHDPTLQVAILKDVTAKDHLGESMSVRRAKEHISNTYMLRLVAAPFKTDDALLVPAAGPCSTCPKRTGVSPQLFGDVADGDTCTDPPCFGAKKAAHYDAIAQAAAAQGKTVITGKEAREIMPDRTTLRGYTRVDEPQAHGTEMKSLRGVLGEDLPTTTLLEDPTTHELIEVLPTAEASKALRKHDHAKAPGAPAKEAEPADPKKIAATYEKRWRTLAIKALHPIVDLSGAFTNHQVDQFARGMLDHTCEAMCMLVLEQMRAPTIEIVGELLQIGVVAQRDGLIERIAKHKDDAGSVLLLMLAALDLQALDKPATHIEALAVDLGLEDKILALQSQVREDMKAEAAAKAPASAAPSTATPKPARTPKIKKTIEQFNSDLVDALRNTGALNAFKRDERVRIKGVTVRDGATYSTMGMHATVVEPSGDRQWIVQPDHLNFPLTLDYTEIEPL